MRSSANVVALPPTSIPPTTRSAGVGFAADSRTVFLSTMRCLDIGVAVASAFAAHNVRLGFYDLSPGEAWQLVAGCLLAANALELAQVYDVRGMGRRSNHLARIAMAWVATMFAVVAAIYFTKTAVDVSRGWVLLWAVFGLVGLLGVRVVAWRCLAHWHGKGRFVANVAIVGDGAAADNLASNVERTSGGYSRVVGVFSLTKPDRSALGRKETTQDLDDLVQLTRCVRIDEIAISLQCPMSAEVSMALAKLGTVPIDVRLCLDLFNPASGAVAGRSIPEISVLARPLAGWPILIKRCMDVAISMALLLVSAPLMASVAILIKLDSPGPVLFRQQRFGFNKNPFTVFKFRTMCAEAAFDTSVPQARRDDPRVTRLGRFLRRTSIDELPQLANVLFGSMSLVGPRPHAIAHDERYASLIDGYLSRHRVMPGITGWAQVNGYRGETDTLEKMARRVEYDLYYIDNWSPIFDVYILLRTVIVSLRDSRAY